MQQLGGIWGDIAGWSAILAGLVSVACLIVRMDRQCSVRPRADAKPVRLLPAREWELVVRRASQDLSRAAELPALQARATVKIESAEHAFNRIVAECASLCRTPIAAPTRDPLPFRGAPRTPRVPEPQRLAA
jgi:hypothetical protein